MKKFIVPVLSICFLISCSSDDVALNTVETTTTDSASNKKITTKSLSAAANTANIYDYSGRLFVEVLDSYLNNYPAQSALTTTVSNVDITALGNPGFVAIGGGYSGLSIANMQWTMANIDSPATVMTKAGLSERGKTAMGNLIDMIPTFEYQSFSASYSSIKTFEATVINDLSLNDVDKRVVLTASSVARYSICYLADKPRRWDRVRNSIVASSGTNLIPSAITTSVSADLLTY